MLSDPGEGGAGQNHQTPGASGGPCVHPGAGADLSPSQAGGAQRHSLQAQPFVAQGPHQGGHRGDTKLVFTPKQCSFESPFHLPQPLPKAKFQPFIVRPSAHFLSHTGVPQGDDSV